MPDKQFVEITVASWWYGSYTRFVPVSNTFLPVASKDCLGWYLKVDNSFGYCIGSDDANALRCLIACRKAFQELSPNHDCDCVKHVRYWLELDTPIGIYPLSCEKWSRRGPDDQLVLCKYGDVGIQLCKSGLVVSYEDSAAREKAWNKFMKQNQDGWNRRAKIGHQARADILTEAKKQDEASAKRQAKEMTLLKKKHKEEMAALKKKHEEENAEAAKRLAEELATIQIPCTRKTSNGGDPGSG